MKIKLGFYIDTLFGDNFKTITIRTTTHDIESSEIFSKLEEIIMKQAKALIKQIKEEDLI